MESKLFGVVPTWLAGGAIGKVLYDATMNSPAGTASPLSVQFVENEFKSIMAFPVLWAAAIGGSFGAVYASTQVTALRAMPPLLLAVGGGVGGTMAGSMFARSQ